MRRLDGAGGLQNLIVRPHHRPVGLPLRLSLGGLRLQGGPAIGGRTLRHGSLILLLLLERIELGGVGLAHQLKTSIYRWLFGLALLGCLKIGPLLVDPGRSRFCLGYRIGALCLCLQHLIVRRAGVGRRRQGQRRRGGRRSRRRLVRPRPGRLSGLRLGLGGAGGVLPSLLPGKHRARLADRRQRFERRILGVPIARGEALAQVFAGKLPGRLKARRRRVAGDVADALFRRLIGCIVGDNLGELVRLRGGLHRRLVGHIHPHLAQGAPGRRFPRPRQQEVREAGCCRIYCADHAALDGRLLEQLVAVCVQVRPHRRGVARVDAGFLDGGLDLVAALHQRVTRGGADPAARNRPRGAAGCAARCCAAHHADRGRDHVGHLLNDAFTHRAQVTAHRLHAGDEALGLVVIALDLPRHVANTAQHAVALVPRLHELLAFGPARVGLGIVRCILDGLRNTFRVAAGKLGGHLHGLAGLVEAARQRAISLLPVIRIKEGVGRSLLLRLEPVVRIEEWVFLSCHYLLQGSGRRRPCHRRSRTSRPVRGSSSGPRCGLQPAAVLRLGWAAQHPARFGC
ncbi:MAG: hypothetical protein BWZ02_03179 [Lentisphaerae bacterium ADurb.BinA184]|nr:MAG: hypothetical protein BWZ02_03179 [Lentisphaerae bacterium ADurb.BinA184]